MQINQTIKKSSNEEIAPEGPPVFIFSPSNAQKHKPSYLFYRTPGNKEHKKIDFIN
jgi:hypothetical protein